MKIIKKMKLKKNLQKMKFRKMKFRKIILKVFNRLFMMK